ncbi:hypothetical protein TRFO_09010 [Tritrichomonas foetus]|uniref:Uncharacterized protein n=1 Tax=Tritrichomonas foetus TaxID=1144522 RepID=A0A1J4JG93_9EUKA|nr:hypothetical protein TRFO_09010 [Tritrichomonas foetus]|eukprot:OHS98162.1 hypothetical protein TRFO_09010 [Tritrichomonas foetus]
MKFLSIFFFLGWHQKMDENIETFRLINAIQKICLNNPKLSNKAEQGITSIINNEVVSNGDKGDYKSLPVYIRIKEKLGNNPFPKITDFKEFVKVLHKKYHDDSIQFPEKLKKNTLYGYLNKLYLKKQHEIWLNIESYLEKSSNDQVKSASNDEDDD